MAMTAVYVGETEISTALSHPRLKISHNFRNFVKGFRKEENLKEYQW